MLQGTVLYCRTTYHRGPYMYYVVRETKACVFVKGMKDITIDPHGDPSYHCETIIGVDTHEGDTIYEKGTGDVNIEYKLSKRVDERGEQYFVGSADYGSPQTFYIWDGKPLQRNTYY